VNHPSVSRRHCELTWSAGSLLARDLDSRHGTRINGELIHEAALNSGDELTLGAYCFLVELAENESAR
jgi:pSer/pThr/pTyr-binding forkhead associated (FHA) protein